MLTAEGLTTIDVRTGTNGGTTVTKVLQDMAALVTVTVQVQTDNQVTSQEEVTLNTHVLLDSHVKGGCVIIVTQL